MMRESEKAATNQEAGVRWRRNGLSNLEPSSLKIYASTGAWGWAGSCFWQWSFCPPACVGCIEEAQGSSEQELHYASLQRLPVPSSEGPDLRGRDKRGTKEDPRADYACIAENKPT
ncbi:leukocyte-specific transcript 1 protein isoform X3 [Pan paniscus]|uniref:leukocyte-specific transcript 1 protein isoform X3 n=1 Tax=Pan paniscus TaxID=9597 RepID=UPI00243709DF|nr:leukocyte-specific transcript 1 protein isoform X3 [Pan paniscus]